MSNTKHTPLPWKTLISGSVVEVQPKSPGKPVVGWTGFDESDVPLVTHKANARLIVRAVNNHYDLLTLLEKIDSLLAEWKNLNYINYGKMQSRFDEDLERVELEIEEAIAAAKGEA